MAAVSSNPRTVEGIFKDFTARRSALVRALTKETRSIEGQAKSNTKLLEESYEEEEEDEHGHTLCGICGGNYSKDEFWICCDVCERWYHGKCVKIMPAKAAIIRQYRCPSCCSKKGRQ